MSNQRLSVRFGLAFALVMAAWLVFAMWLARVLIRDAYAGQSWSALNDLMEGREQHSVEFYLDAWAGVARWLTVALLLAGAAIYLLVLYRRAVVGLVRRVWSRLPPTGVRLVFQTAVGFGFLAAIADVGSRYVRLRGHPGSRFFWEMLYQTPVAAIGTFVLIGLLLGLIALASRSRAPLALAPFLFASLGVYSLLRSLEIGLHAAAAVLFALGVAVQTVRSINRNPAGFRRFLRRSVVSVGLFIVTAMVAIPLVEWSRERRALAGLPDAPTDAPNVLLIILDTVRAQNLSLYGYERATTPNLEEFGRTGVVFDRAIATAPWTLPSHASILTGRYPHMHSASWERPLDDLHPTLAEVLRDRGYRTGGFVANRLFASKRSGLDRGFARYEDQVESPWAAVTTWWLSGDVVQWVRGRLGRHDPWWRTNAEKINERFLDWLSRDEPQPFFAFLNYMEAHEPYLPPEPFDLHFSGTRSLYWTEFNRDYTPGELRQLVDSYDNSLYYLDTQLGRLFAELRARGVLDNTLVVLTSDHGEEFGEHGPNLVSHARTLYAPGVHVPLIVSFPGRIPVGERVTESVSLRDIPATVMDLLGSSSSPFPGYSLLGAGGRAANAEAGLSASLSQVTPGVNWPNAWPAARGAMRSIVSGNLHFIVGPEEERELFDLDLDPWEQRNLDDGAAGHPRSEALQAVLDSVSRR
jgi:arylsulfatase A-like enzyme